MLCFLLVLFQGCNTIYNSHTINLEIIEPGKTLIAPNNKKIAVKYNNSNVEYNPKFAIYFDGTNKIIDPINTDSIASKIYYELFVENLINQNFYDTVIVLNETDYSNIKFSDTLISTIDFESDSIPVSPEKHQKKLMRYFANLITQFPIESKLYSKSKNIDPNLGLYSKQELKDIADSTNADFLFSLDYYSSLDGTNYFPKYSHEIESVHILTFWNIYDLQIQKFHHFQIKADTISWEERKDYQQYPKRKLPPPKRCNIKCSKHCW